MNKNIVLNFGKRVRELRQEQKLSQEELADKIGIHRTYIGSIERGEKSVSIITIEKVAKVFNLSISKLMEGIDV